MATMVVVEENVISFWSCRSFQPLRHCLPETENRQIGTINQNPNSKWSTIDLSLGPRSTKAWTEQSVSGHLISIANSKMIGNYTGRPNFLRTTVENRFHRNLKHFENWSERIVEAVFFLLKPCGPQDSRPEQLDLKIAFVRSLVQAKIFHLVRSNSLIACIADQEKECVLVWVGYVYVQEQKVLT